MTDETLFGWVHISDIHFGHGDASHGWDQKMVLDRLIEDLPQAMAQGAPRPDAILVTGDIAFSGAGRSPAEYRNAEAWLKRLGEAVHLGPDHIFLVPGNHDVNRGVDAKLNVGTIVNALRTGTMMLDEGLRDDDVREILTLRMASYLELATRFAPACLLPPAAEPELFWVHRLAARGLAVRLCGLNTALLSRDDTDQGKLQLGKQQLTLVTTPAAPGEIVIVLTHHPLREWLSDGKAAEQWIESSAHLHLSGHVHEAESAEIRHGVGTHVVNITAGAAHGEMPPEAWVPSSHGYNFAGIVADAEGRLGVRTWPRRWSEKSKSFRTDVDSVPNDERFAYHALRASLPRGAKAAAPALAPAPVTAPPPAASPKAPDEPLQVFVSFAKDDEADAEEVLKRLRLINTKYRFKKAPPLLRAWSVRDLVAGQDVRQEVARHLASADIVLLLVSDAYLSSPDLLEDEMFAAFERNDRREARVLPILLRPCDFAAAPFAGLQFLPYYQNRDDQKPRPVSSLKRDEAFLEVQTQIRASGREPAQGARVNAPGRLHGRG